MRPRFPLAYETMRARTLLLFCLGILAACGPSEEVFISELTASVVYGADDRREVFEHPNQELRRIARESIVALIPASRIERNPDGSYSLFAFSLKDERDLCDDEPFGNQPVAASCSGVLIDDDLVLTAGHCISEQRKCDVFKYVFNYRLDGPDFLAAIADEDVYSCKRVALEADSVGSNLTPDFAVIQLDRPVEGGHVPAAIRPAVALEEGDPISMIGFGSGLPAKIDTGASVAAPRGDGLDYFIVNLDAFEGHSGSATFDASNRLAGILLGGRVPDYVSSSAEGCARANVFDDSEAGEIVHNIAPIVSALCDAGVGSGASCEPDACDGRPCGSSGAVVGVGGEGGDSVAAQSSGCSAATGSPIGGAGLGALLVVIALGRLRRRVV